MRDVVGTVRRPGSASAEGPADPACTDIADTLGGEWREARGQRYLVIDTKFSPGYRHGHTAVADCLPPDDGMWPMLPLLEPAARHGRLVFVDLETTGLAGGAGTCAFLVGCGWFEPPSPSASAGQAACFRVRQFFLASHAAERALLEGVAEVAGGATGVVTYNGKSFDLPLIETRFLYHRMETPFAGVAHVDMLHPARRLWRGDDVRLPADATSCRLTTLEQTLLGHVREGDVPGFEIPARYFHYVRTSDARPLHAVLEHNRLDLLALAMLTARAARLLEDGPQAARTAREAYGLGRLYERAGRLSDAKLCYARAFDDAVLAPEALRVYAILCRRERQHVDAAAAWRRVLALRRCPPPIAREAAEALAVHLEHRERDPGAARRYALQLLQSNISRRRVEAVQYRLARLDRKLGAPTPDVAPLF
ncbi:MAG: hypothetical protein FJW14_17440 [Acidimicrobiia bacterium]|nr:hypothetical protein [Acidimicrobiia bacterium]